MGSNSRPILFYIPTVPKVKLLTDTRWPNYTLVLPLYKRYRKAKEYLSLVCCFSGIFWRSNPQNLVIPWYSDGPWRNWCITSQLGIQSDAEGGGTLGCHRCGRSSGDSWNGLWQLRTDNKTAERIHETGFANWVCIGVSYQLESRLLPKVSLIYYHCNFDYQYFQSIIVQPITLWDPSFHVLSDFTNK